MIANSTSQIFSVYKTIYPQINNVKTTGECLFYNKIIIIFA